MASGTSAKHLIVGTAGHVDHGKTTLIKAMTGIDTDRLKEEQERGLTIDLGFASMKLPSGREVGIVDVPGHERFLKNMLAGASGVDIALLVVAADEGVMPQTREHLDILELLETRQGVVALTKCDAVDEEWLEIVEDDLREALADTFLADANIVRTSGVTGSGIDELVREIDRLADAARQRATEGPFRLPVDRVVTITGFGTVVTGTLVSGTVKVGDPVVILPRGLESRVRQIQIHGKKHDVAYAGSRVAANLVGINVSDVQRGDVVLPPGYLQPTTTLDASVSVLPEAPRPLKNRMRVRLHVGTAEVIGRALLLGAEEIAPGRAGFIQLRLERPVVAARGDRFVLRLYSPMRVLGGGVIVDPAARKHRAADGSVVERLTRKLAGDAADMVQDALALAEAGLTREELARTTGLAAADVDAALQELMAEERVVRTGGRFFDAAAYARLAARMESALRSYHAANAMRLGMPKEELRASLGPRVDQKGFQALLGALTSAGSVVAEEAVVRLPDHKPTLNPRQEELAGRIRAEYGRAGANPPLLSEVEKRYGMESKAVVALLMERGDLIRITPDLLFAREAVQKAESALREFLAAHGQMTVAQFRDVTDSSRKYVVPLLEYFDSKRVTRRVGDLRVLAR